MSVREQVTSAFVAPGISLVGDVDASLFSEMETAKRILDRFWAIQQKKMSARDS